MFLECVPLPVGAITRYRGVTRELRRKTRAARFSQYWRSLGPNVKRLTWHGNKMDLDWRQATLGETEVLLARLGLIYVPSSRGQTPSSIRSNSSSESVREISDYLLQLAMFQCRARHLPMAFAYVRHSCTRWPQKNRSILVIQLHE